VAYSPVIACHHRGDVLKNVRTLALCGIVKKLYRTWNAGGKIARPPIAHASRSRDCSYNEGAESVSEELEATEG
jgi:hypothetical protein